MKLRINWIIASPNMSGGTKSNRLIAEAMHRRGHDVVMYHGRPRKRRMTIRHPRLLARHLWAMLAMRKRQTHQLEQASIPIIPSAGRAVTVNDVRDADVTIATWWATRETIEPWPESKGIKAYFIRHHELHGGDPERVAATYRMPGVKLVIARWLQRTMEEEYGDPNSVLVPNGVAREQFDSEPREKQQVPTVGLMYSHVGWKAVDFAAEAIADAQREIPDLHVVCFGSRPRPSTTCRELKNFTYHPRPAQDTIADIYKSADMWLLPSDTEGFGMPGIEAAACHCPVIATRCGGPEDYVEDGASGHLVDVRDSVGLTEAIVRVARMPDAEWKRMSARSYAISKEFDWDHSAEILERCLVTAVRERNIEYQPVATDSGAIH